MSLYPQELIDHLAGGCTTLARAFAVTRRDGVVMGFTDHDRDLAFDGITFRADSGLTAKALQMGTGLAVDNSEAWGRSGRTRSPRRTFWPGAMTERKSGRGW